MTTAAFFDVDGTLVNRTIVHYYIYLRRRLMSPLRAALWHPAYLLKCLYYLALDAVDRARFNLAFYTDYRGLPAADVRRLAPECFREVICPHVFAQARAVVETHRREGRSLVLVTGSLDFLMQPLAEEFGFHHLLAASLVELNGRFTGVLSTPPIGKQEKARMVREYAAAHGVDLSASYAYGDSLADLPMLEAVGYPNVVNPSRRLRNIARSRGWPVHRWALEAGGP